MEIIDAQIHEPKPPIPLGGNYGMATALSLMLTGFLIVFSLVYLRATRSWSTR